MKEIDNLLGNECFGEVGCSTLAQEMKGKALPILMLMAVKRNGSLKARGVANGSAQRLCASKEDVPSPAPGFYAFKYICGVIAKEGRGAATAGLPGFFLQAGQDEWLLLKLAGPAALVLAECDEKWRKHLRKEHGRWATCAARKKAIYGAVSAALLAYKKLAKLLTEWEQIGRAHV